MDDAPATYSTARAAGPGGLPTSSTARAAGPGELPTYATARAAGPGELPTYSTARAAGSGDALPGPLQALLAAAHAVEDRIERSLAELDLSLGKLKVLQHLYSAAAPLPLGEIAQRSSCVRSNITQLVDRLEADGLVRRVSDPADRRSVRAALTAEGNRRLMEGALVLEREEQRLAAQLGADGVLAIAEALGRVGCERERS